MYELCYYAIVESDFVIVLIIFSKYREKVMYQIWDILDRYLHPPPINPTAVNATSLHMLTPTGDVELWLTQDPYSAHAVSN